ncbi:MarR family winged helix-turn-helix transcriptional regulator [Streptomyces odontomachi]|uniref:MarR family winged helix-turn-helix transcriptional regulator n=1 Tax=Streptomyces odontomachi TaxID=2944940 RepID=UPI00210DB0C3|nr:MarR family winged helix-turn-helix transcriptional regulator [Streptomyces sp. ODS25]
MHGDLQALGRAVKQTQYRQHRALDTALSAVGTTLAQWDALRAISRSPGASARTLAAATFQSEQAFGALAGRLLAHGLVERRPGHGRRNAHHLTPRGEQLLAAGHKVADEVLAACFAPLSDAERTTLLDLLQRLAAEDDGRPDASGSGTRPSH